eukprot:scaffold11940_cov80-Skeletonema_marinoi.AAC.2
MPTSSTNNRRKSIAVAPTGENGPINRASPSVRFEAKDVASSKRRESLPASAIPNKNYSNNINTNNSNNSNSAVTPGKKSSNRKSSGEDNPDVVLAYHFEGLSRTPYSTKKRKTLGLKERQHNHHSTEGSGRISQEMKRSRTDDSSSSTANNSNSNALNDTFNMGGNTAEINS